MQLHTRTKTVMCCLSCGPVAVIVGHTSVYGTIPCSCDQKLVTEHNHIHAASAQTKEADSVTPCHKAVQPFVHLKDSSTSCCTDSRLAGGRFWRENRSTATAVQLCAHVGSSTLTQKRWHCTAYLMHTIILMEPRMLNVCSTMKPNAGKDGNKLKKPAEAMNTIQWVAHPPRPFLGKGQMDAVSDTACLESPQPHPSYVKATTEHERCQSTTESQGSHASPPLTRPAVALQALYSATTSATAATALPFHAVPFIALPFIPMRVGYGERWGNNDGSPTARTNDTTWACKRGIESRSSIA